LNIIPSILLRNLLSIEVENQDRHARNRTSYTENRVDALALWADEGRGDRRNVPGELHASEEPGDSEWGNPSRVMSGDLVVNK
jgi:hypothetical protein